MMESQILLCLEERWADLDSFEAVGCSYKGDWHCYGGNWWCARNAWIAGREEPRLTPDRFYYERWLLVGCKNFKRLARDCAANWQANKSEPYRFEYYNRQEYIYKPALLLGCRSPEPVGRTLPRTSRGNPDDQRSRAQTAVLRQGRAIIDETYERLASTPSDINEHLPTLRALAMRCVSVIELGVRDVVSSWAFASGLPVGGRIWMNDVVDCEIADFISQCLREKSIDAIFEMGDDLKVPLPPPADLVFIDTWHVYAQLSRELERYEPLARKYIAMHDTSVDAVHGESTRMGCDPALQSVATGFPEHEIRLGLRPAVEEFLERHAHSWVLHRVDTNNNGLTVLRRAVQTDTAFPKA